MARSAKKPGLTPHQAAFVVERALAERKLSSADVKRYVGQMHEEISTIEKRLVELRDAIVQPVKRALHLGSPVTRRAGGDPPFPKRKAGGDPPFPKKAAKRKPISAERRASMKLQGEYLGLLARLPKSQRSKYQKIAREEGRDKAIAAMKKAV